MNKFKEIWTIHIVEDSIGLTLSIDNLTKLVDNFHLLFVFSFHVPAWANNTHFIFVRLKVKQFKHRNQDCCLDPAGRNFVEFQRFLVAGEPPEATDTWAASSSSSAGKLVLI